MRSNCAMHVLPELSEENLPVIDAFPSHRPSNGDLLNDVSFFVRLLNKQLSVRRNGTSHPLFGITLHHACHDITALLRQTVPQNCSGMRGRNVKTCHLMC